MRKIITWTIYLLAIFVPLTFTTINSELFEFPKFILLLSGTLIITIAWIFDIYLTRNWKMKLSLMDYSILAILATQTLATIFSIHPYTSFWGYYSRFHQGLLTTISYTIIYFAAIKWLDTKSTQKLIKISIGTAFFISLYAILEHFGIDKNLWIQDVQNRVFSTLGQPNWLAAYLIPNIFLVFYLHQIKERRWPSLYSIFLFLALFVALLFTRSRSSLLAFALAFVAYWLLTLRSFSFPKIKNSLLLTSIILFLTTIFAGSALTPPILSTIYHSTSTISPAPTGTTLETGGTESGTIRQIVWTGALQLIKERPILGTGPETFAYTYYWDRPVAHNMTSEWDFIYNKAHNEYLNIAAGAGLIGLIAYLSWHLAMFLAIFTRVPPTKKVKHDEPDRLRAIYPVLGATIISFTVTNFFGFSVIPVYLLTTLIAAMATSIKQEPIKDPTTHSMYRLATILLGLFSLFFPLRLFYADYLYAKGKSYLDAGRPAVAIPLLEQAVSYRPHEDLFLSSLGESYAVIAVASAESKDTVQQTKTGTYLEHALAAAEQTRTDNPWHLNYYKSRAKIYLTLAALDPKYNSLAKNELDRARQLAPTDPKLAYNLALIDSRLGLLDQAAKELRAAITLKPDYPDPYYALTLLYEQTKEVSQIPDLLKSAKTNLATYSAQLKEKIDKYTE
jgi:O-antigen ligase